MPKRAPSLEETLGFLQKVLRHGKAISEELKRLRGDDVEGEEEAGEESGPPPEVAQAMAWLGLDPEDECDEAAVRAAYLEAAKRLHPDKGGSDKKMRRTIAARDTILAWLKEAA